MVKVSRAGKYPQTRDIIGSTYKCPYETLYSSGIPTRDAKRRGAGWLPGLADIG